MPQPDLSDKSVAAALENKPSDNEADAFVREMAARVNKKPSQRGIEFAKMLINAEADGKPIKVRKSSYKYRNDKYKRISFGYDLRTFLHRHDMKIIDLSCILGYSYWTVHNWFEKDAKVPHNSDEVLDVMRRIDAITGNHP